MTATAPTMDTPLAVTDALFFTRGLDRDAAERVTAASAMIAPTQAFIFRTETALPICLICSVFVPANS